MQGSRKSFLGSPEKRNSYYLIYICAFEDVWRDSDSFKNHVSLFHFYVCVRGKKCVFFVWVTMFLFLTKKKVHTLWKIQNNSIWF